ncbi:response regulator transcription factor (plasmid) [Paraclostridium ghonii]|uniref:response regulator transcription factor n=1 Tax=Paraclostridium ghonii TaxID=29358 RepID=UPI00202CB197|nr:response regulator transcription factor [Paeniclostridium ghonii]MCM0167406.1 response regulator transcription factor [Paeniclostridium ghonii]
MKLLIIEDEEDLVNLLARGLRSLGYVVDISTDGREGLELFSINEYDLVVLDINLPSMDGRLILDEIRKENEECKVIILSALSDYKQRIEGLDRGANDYLVKPFDFGELAARIRSLLRRNFIQKNVKLKYENIILDTALRCVYSCDNENIKLSPKEFALLEYLIINKGRVVSAEELIEHVWDSDECMFSNAVKVHISTLRKKLNPYCKNDIILNIRGEGYIINEN